jgi:hypothetical protein
VEKRAPLAARSHPGMRRRHERLHKVLLEIKTAAYNIDE